MKTDKILLDLLGLASLTGLAYGGYQIYKLLRDEKQEKERKSSFGGNQKTITFTLTNNTDKTQSEYLFDSRSGQDNPNVGISPNMSFFNRELSNKPKKLTKVEFRNLGANIPTPVPPPQPPTPQLANADVAAPVPIPAPASVPQVNQAEAPFMMICKDASGQASERPYTPMITANQFQSGITSVDMRGTILDGECYMKYTMYPNSKVAIVLFYEDMPLTGLLNKSNNEGGSWGDAEKLKTLMNINPSESNNNPKAIAKNKNSEPKELDLKSGAVALVAVGAVGFLAYKYLITPKRI